MRERGVITSLSPIPASEGGGTATGDSASLSPARRAAAALTRQPSDVEGAPMRSAIAMRERGVISSPSPVPAPRSLRTDAERGRCQPIAPPDAQRPKDAAAPSSSPLTNEGRRGSHGGALGRAGCPRQIPSGRADTGRQCRHRAAAGCTDDHCSATPQPTSRTAHSGTPPRYVSASPGQRVALGGSG